MKTFPTCNTDINLWSIYPCVFCGANNHSMEKCQKRESLQGKPSKKEARCKGHFLKKNMENDKKGLRFQVRNKNVCTHCGKSGHWVEKCCTLHP
jgi:hypothetical protein